MALVNVKKKVEKKAGDLGIPESIVAACTTNPSGTMTKMLAKELGGVVGAAVAGRSSSGGDSPDAPEDGLAGTFPDGKHFLVLTDERLMLTDVSTWTGAPKAVVAEWPRDQIAAIEVESGKLAEPLTIAFTDGTAVQVEGAKGTDPGSVAAGFSA